MHFTSHIVSLLAIMLPIKNLLLVLILLFGSASYLVGLNQMLKGKYAPSVFSRVIWLLLAIISFAGVLASHSTSASVLLAAVFLLGNAAICVASFWKGTKETGKLEFICLGLLAASGIVWMVFNAPLVSLCVSLFAHLVGAVPTYKRVWENPKNESVGFWSLFFIASLLSIFASWGEPLKLVIFPIYFSLFDGSMTSLSLRKAGSKSTS